MNPADDIRIEVARLTERIGTVDTKANAAHGRVDRMEDLLRVDLKLVSDKIDSLTAFMERAKGWAAAALLVASLAGAAIMKAISHFIK